MAAAKGPLHMVRGTGEEEKLLKNAKTEYSEEAEEIATYTAIETVAESVGDRDTARLARSIRREEERMANYLQRLIPQLSKAVVRSEVPSNQRDGGGSRRRRSRSSSRRGSSRARGSRSRARGSGSRRTR
jgi:rubrerythrin